MNRNPLNNRSRLILAGLLAGALMALLSTRARQVRQEQAKPVGRLTAQQVLSLAEPICHAVATQPGALTLTADASCGLHNFWNVVCSDAAGHDLLDLTWNADTGKLSEVGVRHFQTSTGPLLNSARAITWGRFWLRALCIRPAPEEWRLLHSPVCMAKIRWSLDYAAAGRRVSMQLEAHTGALVNALFMPHDGAKSSDPAW